MIGGGGKTQAFDCTGARKSLSALRLWDQHPVSAQRLHALGLDDLTRPKLEGEGGTPAPPFHHVARTATIFERKAQKGIKETGTAKKCQVGSPFGVL